MSYSPPIQFEFIPAYNPPRLPPNAIHIWRIELDRWPVEASEPLLNENEQKRAKRFATETLQRRFTVARASLRRILAGYLCSTSEDHTSPENLAFEYGPNGKPSLALNPGNKMIQPLEFNLSHSDELALLAVSRQPVGIDIEPIRPLTDALAIARRTFSASATEELTKLNDDELPRRFFQHWTAMEARAKLHGGGIFSDERNSTPRTLRHFEPQQEWIACLASNLANPANSGFHLAPNAG